MAERVNAHVTDAIKQCEEQGYYTLFLSRQWKDRGLLDNLVLPEGTTMTVCDKNIKLTWPRPPPPLECPPPDHNFARMSDRSRIYYGEKKK